MAEKRKEVIEKLTEMKNAAICTPGNRRAINGTLRRLRAASKQSPFTQEVELLGGMLRIEGSLRAD